jgi:hypothetical protein
MPDTHSHDARCTGTSIPTSPKHLRHGQQWAHMDTRHDTSTTTPPSVMPPAGQRRRVLRIGPSSAGAWRTCPGTSFAMFGRSWALGFCATG